MAQAAVAPRIGTLAGANAHEQTLDKFEQLADEIDAALARNKSNGILRRSLKNWRRGDIVRAGQLALEATTEDGSNAQAFHMLAMALERMGHLHKALVTYEQAFKIDPTDPDLLINLGLTAWNLKLIDGAEKMFRLFIEARPNSPLGYNNLGTILADQGRQSVAIDTLRGAIMRMPTESVLWNSLATVLAEDGRAEESLVFYKEAIKLNPAFARPWHNIGFAYSHLGQLDDALDAYDHALKLASDPTEILEGTHSRGVCLIGMGRLEEGFKDYEMRNSPQFRAYVHQMLRTSAWKGEALDGKRILVIAEQGLGDEFMFANILPDIQRAVGPDGKLQICVDPRLVELFQRSFPDAQVGAYDDRKLISKEGNKELRFIPWAFENGEPDFHVLMGSVVPYYRKVVTDFPHESFLKPDATRVAEFREQLSAMGPEPKIGICWRSMMLGSKRKRYYSALDSWGPILKTPGVKFVNVQYGDCREELESACEMHGVKVEIFDDLDLKDDIDGAAALSAALDLVISAPTAAAATAASVGTDVWFLTAGRTWPQLGTDEFPWYKSTRVFSPIKFADWSELMPRVAGEVADFAAKGK
jgi:tetratricopeptide (TPR) repeat protein